jgi:hypothetical protein
VAPLAVNAADVPEHSVGVEAVTETVMAGLTVTLTAAVLEQVVAGLTAVTV